MSSPSSNHSSIITAPVWTIVLESKLSESLHFSRLCTWSLIPDNMGRNHVAINGDEKSYDQQGHGCVHLWDRSGVSSSPSHYHILIHQGSFSLLRLSSVIYCLKYLFLTSTFTCSSMATSVVPNNGIWPRPIVRTIPLMSENHDYCRQNFSWKIQSCVTHSRSRIS